MAINPVKTLPTLNEIVEATPITFTCPATAAPILGVYGLGNWCLSYSIRVRSMGTATYVGIGDVSAQNYRLTAVGDIMSYSCNRYEVIDLTRKYATSDTGDAVIEIIASYLPVRLYGNVNRAAGTAR